MEIRVACFDELILSGFECARVKKVNTVNDVHGTTGIIHCAFRQYMPAVTKRGVYPNCLCFGSDDSVK
ncbi:hypothetical protein E4U58_007598 [Claviceps cyperi]|nr:hypothetical protein E4U58_007598 [Claviceps cyperi]